MTPGPVGDILCISAGLAPGVLAALWFRHRLHQRNEAVRSEITALKATLSRRREKLTGQDRRHARYLSDRLKTSLKQNLELRREMERQRLDDQLRGDLESITRHDLKSSLTLITGYPDLLLEVGGLAPEQQKILRIIRDTGLRMLERLRTHSELFRLKERYGHFHPRPVDLVDLACGLEEELIPLFRTRKVRLDLNLNGRRLVGGEQLLVAGERSLLDILVRCLLVNAVEASDPGDTVELAFFRGTRTRMVVHNAKPVPEPMRERFFDKHATHGKKTGTGLGTYAAELVARLHDAHITVRTNDRKGTLVRVAFPCLNTPEHLADSA